jgi:DNA-binding CsgD family transcriptional regulator
MGASSASTRASVAELVVKLIGPLTTDKSSAESRRHALVKGLADAVGSDFTFWAWGRGHPQRGPVVPVAIISIGGSAETNRGWNALALSPLMDREIRNPIAPLVRPQKTTLRRDLFSDAKWRGSEVRKAIGDCIGMDEWLHAVRYCGPDTWSNFWFSRLIGKSSFTEDHRLILDLVLRHVTLLHSVEAGDDLPADKMLGLTHRQRTVLLSLLDGQSRKLIASSLNISEHTVNEHVKALFQHFGVRSSTALAAKFLRGR